MKAYCLLRQDPWYRKGAFITGLAAAGCEVFQRRPDTPDKDTLLVIWNRYGDLHALAQNVERCGGKVIVAENGYLGAGGGSPKFQVHPAGPEAGHYYALSLGYHNDSAPSLTPRGDGSRWERLGVPLKPWREAGSHILVCPNRSFGPVERAMHPDWAERCVARLKKVTQKPIRLRPHPGNNAPKRPLSEDLKGAWAVFIWSSSAGVHALAEGIPVFCEAPNWILKEASAYGHIEHPELPDRLEPFRRMAWAQWTLTEIQNGDPFRQLLAAPW